MSPWKDETHIMLHVAGLSGLGASKCIEPGEQTRQLIHPSYEEVRLGAPLSLFDYFDLPWSRQMPGIRAL